MRTRYSICFHNLKNEVISWRTVTLVVAPHVLSGIAHTARPYTLRVPHYDGLLSMALRATRPGRRPHWHHLGIEEASIRNWSPRTTHLVVGVTYINLSERFGSPIETRV